ncbi:MAG: toxin-antitoxin system YwqK family antitoxin [Kordia sp.]|uniref:toxin-antitoxin system YwqK family antitoxin n=1 Tax=Kordia sp. TaxID=1965332 RepID=UPI0038599C8C
MKLSITLFLVFFIVPQKRIINTHDFDYEFYISSEKIKKPKVEKTYFWYKSGEIHQSTADIGGAVLVNTYIKHYKSKQLAEKGIFDKGLKDGVWKNWYKNGNLSKIEKWRKGFRHGDFITYTKNGKKKVEGKYRNHKKHGIWINYVSHDTLVYKKGIIVPKKQKDTIKRAPFLKRIFKRKKKKTKKEDSKKKKPNAKKT